MSLSRSALFVPATRVDRIPKALQSGADYVIVDLEDAVEFNAKDSARENLEAFAQANPQARFLVRVNDAKAEWFDADIAMCGRVDNIAGVMLPKAESARQIELAARAGKPVYPIVESALGIANLAELCQTPGVARVSFGALDLALDLNMDDDSDGARALLDHVRCQISIQSRAAGILPPLDGVFPDIANTQGLAKSVAFAKGMGYAGVLCIHPSQIAIIHEVFEPTEEEKAWATRVLEMANETGLAAFKLDGKMVDMPVIEKAKQILQIHPAAN